MKTATILLDQNDNYIMDSGKLPERPWFDKAYLKAFYNQQNVSKDGFNMLPPSIRNSVTCHEMYDGDVTPTTIREIAESHLLIVIRSYEKGEGKKFRLNNFKMMIQTEVVEIWIRNYE